MPCPLLIFSQSDYLIRLWIQIHILNDKQCRSRSVGFFRSQLIWIYTVCKGKKYLGSAGQGLTLWLRFWLQTDYTWILCFISNQTGSTVIAADKALLFFFNQKLLIFFLNLHENICCGYSLEVPHRGTSKEYPQYMLSWRNKQNIYRLPTLI